MKGKNYAKLSSCGGRQNGMRCPCADREAKMNLRYADSRTDSCEQAWGSICRNVCQFFAELFYCQPNPVNSMCKYYGHVIEGAWKGNFPRCMDCALIVSSSDQLRKISVVKTYRVA